MTRRPLGVAAIIAFGGALSGCSLVTGPVSMGGPDGSELCVPAPLGHQLLVGDFIRVPAGIDVVVRKVDLLDPEGIEVNHAWLAPPLDGALGSAEYPPAPSPAWDARVDAEGAEASAGHNNMIVLVERTGDDGARAAAVQVEYSVGGVVYTVHGSMRITMKDDCGEVDPDEIL
jgi:hypothetical protein